MLAGLETSIVQGQESYVKNIESLSRIQLKRLQSIVLAILQTRGNEEAEIACWENTLQSIQLELVARVDRQTIRRQPSPVDDLTIVTDYSLEELKQAFNKTCNEVEEPWQSSSTDTFTSDSSDSELETKSLTEKEMSKLIRLAEQLSKFYGTRQDMKSIKERTKWILVIKEMRGMLSSKAKISMAVSSVFDHALNDQNVEERQRLANSLIEKIPHSRKIFIQVQQQLSLTSSEIPRIRTFIEDLENKPEAKFTIVALSNGKSAIIGRSDDGHWFVSKQNKTPDPAMKKLFDESLQSDPVLNSLFQYLPFEEPDFSQIPEKRTECYIKQGTSARVFLLDVQRLTTELLFDPNVQNPSQRVAVKLFTAGWINDKGEQSIEREWGDLHEVRRIDGTMRGYGLLVDPKPDPDYFPASTSGVRAIVLPCLKTELGTFVREYSGQNFYKTIVPCLRDISSTLRQMHSQNLVHNDIKLPNILVDYEKKDQQMTLKRVVMTDFQNLSLTAEEDVAATGSYCFREVLNEVNSKNLSAQRRIDLQKRMDVQALGVTMYKILSRNEQASPYPLETDPRLEFACMDSSKPYQELPSSVPFVLRELIKRMLCVNDPTAIPSMEDVYNILKSLDEATIEEMEPRKKSKMDQTIEQMKFKDANFRVESLASH